MKKKLILSVVFLLISVIIIPISANNIESTFRQSSNGNILYVGGSGEGNYTKIQDAIDDACDGDTVFVFDDSSPYYGNVVVNKSINLIGEDKNTTVIDGSGVGGVVFVSADSTRISGFTLQNSGNGTYYDAGIVIHSSYNIINDNFISDNNQFGIFFTMCKYNTISYNHISNNKASGILLEDGVNYNTITGNTIISNNWHGIVCYFGSSYHTITGNYISSNNGDGIYLDISWGNTITGNTINSNSYGIIMESSYGNNITSNNILNHSVRGISCKGDSHIIEKNNFIGNLRNAETSIFSNNVSWNKNYWDNWIGIRFKFPIFQKFPKIIWGIFFPIFPWAFDWHPAKEPYDIGV